MDNSAVVALSALLGWASQYLRGKGMGNGWVVGLSLVFGIGVTPLVMPDPGPWAGDLASLQVWGNAILVTWATVTLTFLGGNRAASFTATAAKDTRAEKNVMVPPMAKPGPLTKNLVRKASDPR